MKYWNSTYARRYVSKHNYVFEYSDYRTSFLDGHSIVIWIWVGLRILRLHVSSVCTSRVVHAITTTTTVQ